MSKDKIGINSAFKKTSKGNYFGYYMGYYVSTDKKAHGGWRCTIGKGGKWLWTEGNFSAYFTSIDKAKQWAKDKIIGEFIKCH